jgi:hypothetical protein
MSDTPSSEPTKRMTTRSGARDKMAKVMDRIRSGGIVEEPLSEEVPARRNKTGKKGKVANRSPTKKASTMKNSTTKKANTEGTKDIASKLAEIEDRFLKKAEAARSSHAHYLSDEVTGNET